MFKLVCLGQFVVLAKLFWFTDSAIEVADLYLQRLIICIKWVLMPEMKWNIPMKKEMKFNRMTTFQEQTVTDKTER